MIAAPTRIWLCADDYGISPSVNVAIRELITRGRINATSVMVVSPSFNRAEAQALGDLRGNAPRTAIGLHVTLTVPFRPLRTPITRNDAAAFPSLSSALVLGIMRQFVYDKLVSEITAQFDAFAAAFGRAPDFVDGHQHVQLFPQICDAVLTVAKAKAPLAWVRQCGRSTPLAKRLADRKGLLLDVLSRGFRVRAAQYGVPTNPSFAGTYAFAGKADYGDLFETFLEGLTDNSVVMCHPGFVDEYLKRLDPLTGAREREYIYFTGDRFPAALAARGLALA